jgi:hypothetical protein
LGPSGSAELLKDFKLAGANKVSRKPRAKIGRETILDVSTLSLCSSRGHVQPYETLKCQVDSLVGYDDLYSVELALHGLTIMAGCSKFEACQRRLKFSIPMTLSLKNYIPNGSGETSLK